MPTDDASTDLLLLAGTGEGLYLVRTTHERREWSRWGPYLEGYDVSHAVLDPRDGRTIYAAATGGGCPAVYRSRDAGKTWSMAGPPFEVDHVWHVEPGGRAYPGRIYAGVMPAGIYRSDDFGDSWVPLPGLNDHETRGDWWEGGAGGIYLHRIMVDEERPNRLYAGISVAGLFRSDDCWESWQPRNEGIDRIEVVEIRHPEVHRCLHSAAIHPPQPNVLFQQNHIGVYRSDDAGDTWVDISAGLPDRFGFVIAVSRETVPAVYVVPQDLNEIRYSGQLTVYRSRDAGRSWQVLSNGLPVVERMTLYREGLATDPFEPAGVYFGTSDGYIWWSRDGGDAWEALASDLGGVRSVTCGLAGTT